MRLRLAGLTIASVAVLVAGCSSPGTRAGGSGGSNSGAASGGTGGGAAGRGPAAAGTGGGSSGGTGGRVPDPGSGGAVPIGGLTGTGSGGSGPLDAGAGGGSSPPIDAAAFPLVDGGGAGVLGEGPTMPTTVHQDISVHDPAMIWDGKRYYLFATGRTASIRVSTNLLEWAAAGRYQPAVPAWVATAMGVTPDANTPWAPDVSYFNGQFHVYYSASVFGRNTSVIGLTTNTTLDPAAPGYAWVDQGLVVQTVASDDYNAIDPNVAFDAAGAPWLAFGSFWSGIKLRKLDRATGKLAADDPTLYSIASRNGGAIEAPSIILRGGYYYLFVSFDVCCRNVNSTYRTMVGRSSAITGPYVDSAGLNMMQSGGDQLLTTTGRYIGPGGGTAWQNGASYLYAHHYYDGQANGASKLSVRPINFTADGWVTLGEALFP